MKILKDIELKNLSTFKVKAKAKYFVKITKEEDIFELIKTEEFKNNDIYLLGIGANTLFKSDFSGLIVKVNIKGTEIISENDEHILVKVSAGEDWEEFVEWAVENNYGGIENLTMIPSSLGGAVSQNIAAYGQNIMDVVDSVETFDLKEKEFQTFTNKDCEYEYRSSIFKRKYKNRFLIVSATFKLNKIIQKLETNYHERSSRYGSLEEELKTFAKEPYSIKDIMIAVQNIRTRKLPSVEEYGTCGSIFANPIITKDKYLKLAKKIPELQSYPIDKLQYSRKNWSDIDEEFVKIPAGRIIDYLGWLGKWEGNVGVYDKHALCVVTNKKASGQEVFDFLEKIKENVKAVYDIDLKYEINII